MPILSPAQPLRRGKDFQDGKYDPTHLMNRFQMAAKTKLSLTLNSMGISRIGTKYLRPGGTSPLKGASLIVGDVYIHNPSRGRLKDSPCLGNATS